MCKLETSAWLTLGTGIVPVFAIVLCHLALTDIWHGERSVELEWKIVQLGIAAIICFHAAALATAVFALKVARRQMPWRADDNGASSATRIASKVS